MPRNDVDPEAHVQDIIAAVNYIAESRPELDSSRLSLFGHCMAGGLVIQAAAKLQDRVKAVISVVPMLDGRHNLWYSMESRGVFGSLRLLLCGVTDMVRGVLGMSPAYVPIIGLKDKHQFAVIEAAKSEFDEYWSRHTMKQTPPVPYLGGWQNRVTARSIFKYMGMRPLQVVDLVSAPILIVHPAVDHVVPNYLIPMAARQAKHPGSRVFVTEYRHFEQATKGFYSTVQQMKGFMREFSHPSMVELTKVSSQT